MARPACTVLYSTKKMQVRTPVPRHSSKRVDLVPVWHGTFLRDAAMRTLFSARPPQRPHEERSVVMVRWKSDSRRKPRSISHTRKKEKRNITATRRPSFLTRSPQHPIERHRVPPRNTRHAAPADPPRPRRPRDDIPRDPGVLKPPRRHLRRVDVRRDPRDVCLCSRGMYGRSCDTCALTRDASATSRVYRPFVNPSLFSWHVQKIDTKYELWHEIVLVAQCKSAVLADGTGSPYSRRNHTRARLPQDIDWPTPPAKVNKQAS